MSLANTVKGKQATVLSIKNEPSTSIMVQKNSDKWYDFTAVGTIATAPQICNVFSHPFLVRQRELRHSRCNERIFYLGWDRSFNLMDRETI